MSLETVSKISIKGIVIASLILSRTLCNVFVARNKQSAPAASKRFAFSIKYSPASSQFSVRTNRSILPKFTLTITISAMLSPPKVSLTLLFIRL